MQYFTACNCAHRQFIIYEQLHRLQQSPHTNRTRQYRRTCRSTRNFPACLVCSVEKSIFNVRHRNTAREGMHEVFFVGRTHVQQKIDSRAIKCNVRARGGRFKITVVHMLVILRCQRAPVCTIHYVYIKTGSREGAKGCIYPPPTIVVP